MTHTPERMEKTEEEKNKEAAWKLLEYFQKGGHLYTDPDNQSVLLTEDNKKEGSKQIPNG